MRLIVFMVIATIAVAQTPSPLTTTERLALTAIFDRQKALQDETRQFSKEVCEARGIKDQAECAIDPNSMTVTRKPAQSAEPAKEAK